MIRIRPKQPIPSAGVKRPSTPVTAGLLIVLVAVVLGCAGHAIGDGSRSAATRSRVANLSRLWSPTSPFNRPLPRNLAVLPESAGWVAALSATAVAGIYPNSQAWTTPLYHANASTPLTPFYIANRHLQLPLPYDPAWRPDQTPDGSIAILDDATGCLYEMSLVNPTAHTANAEATFNVVDGTGVHTSMGVSGSSLAFLGGMIRPRDIASGVIRHALRLATPLNSPEHVSPATSSDGVHPGGIPEGQLIRLDPTLDLGPYHLDPFQLMVAHALQTYGAYNADSAGGLTVAAENTLDGSTYRYTVSALPRELVSHLQFVRPPASTYRIESGGGRTCRVRPAPKRHRSHKPHK
jgi:hypothetical protein